MQNDGAPAHPAAPWRGTPAQTAAWQSLAGECSPFNMPCSQLITGGQAQAAIKEASHFLHHLRGYAHPCLACQTHASTTRGSVTPCITCMAPPALLTRMMLACRARRRLAGSQRPWRWLQGRRCQPSRCSAWTCGTTPRAPGQGSPSPSLRPARPLSLPAWSSLWTLLALLRSKVSSQLRTTSKQAKGRDIRLHRCA